MLVVRQEKNLSLHYEAEKHTHLLFLAFQELGRTSLQVSRVLYP